MKAYISANWKKILYVICGIVIIINLILTLRTPNNVMYDYYKYGPTYSTRIIDIKTDGNEISNDLTGAVAEEGNMSFDTAKVVVIFALLIIGCFILDDIAKGKADKKK